MKPIKKLFPLSPAVRQAVSVTVNTAFDRRIKSVMNSAQSAARDVVADAISKSFENPSMREIQEVTSPVGFAQSVGEPKAIDAEQLFQLYAVYCGDVKRTALAAGLPEEMIVALEASQNWKDKIKILIDLRTSARPGDSERGINRAVNFIQAHRYRNVLQRVMEHISKLTNDELDDMICSATVDKAGNVTKKITTRAFADLASAMEKCHAMSYSALNDTVGERKEREDEPDNNKTAAEMHLQITRAMEQVRLSNTAPALTSEAQVDSRVTQTQSTVTQ